MIGEILGSVAALYGFTGFAIAVFLHATDKYDPGGKSTTGEIVGSYIFAPFIWPLAISQTKRQAEHWEQHRLENSPKGKTQKLIAQGVLIADGIPDPQYELASIIATKIVRNPELIKKRSTASGSYEWYDWVMGKTEVSIMEHSQGNKWSVSYVRIGRESFEFKDSTKSLINEAVGDAMRILKEREASEKLAKERKRALDAIEIVMDLPKPPKLPKPDKQVVEGCEFSCCNPDVEPIRTRM